MLNRLNRRKERNWRFNWNIETGISEVPSRISTLLDPSASLPHELALRASFSNLHFFSPNDKDPPIAWSVAEIVVDPAYQRLGIGMKLMEWGMDRAKRDGIPIILEATPAGQRLYEKAGFVGYGTWRWGPEKEMVSLKMRWYPNSSSKWELGNTLGAQHLGNAHIFNGKMNSHDSRLIPISQYLSPCTLYT